MRTPTSILIIAMLPLALLASACAEPCNAVTCYEGCCGDDGRCMVASPDFANQFCGQKGQACHACGATATCSASGTCVTTCSQDTCTGGCCSAGICRGGGDLDACGSGGGSCEDCSAQGANYRCTDRVCAQCRSSGSTCVLGPSCCSMTCLVGSSTCQ